MHLEQEAAARICDDSRSQMNSDKVLLDGARPS